MTNAKSFRTCQGYGRMSCFLICLICISLAVGGCATVSKGGLIDASLVGKVKTQYPNADYLMAEGAGQRSEEAVELARKALSKKLDIKIDPDLRATEPYLSFKCPSKGKEGCFTDQVLLMYSNQFWGSTFSAESPAESAPK